MISDLWKSDANWFVTWFNTPAYHALYGARDEAEAVRFIQALTDRVFDGHARNVLMLPRCWTPRRRLRRSRMQARHRSQPQ